MSDELEAAAAAGDGDAMVALAGRLERRARDLRAEAHEWIRRRGGMHGRDVLGRDLTLHCDGVSDLPGAGIFTVITPYAERALNLLRPVASELLSVDEPGGIQEDVPSEGVDPPFTPKSVELRSNHFAVQLIFDTEGEMTGPMGRTMVAILTGALGAARLPAHLTGDRPDLRPQLSIVEDE